MSMTNSVKSGFDLYDEEDFESAISAFQAEAADGSVIALIWLGYLHEVGKGVAVSFEEAERYYAQSMDAGSEMGAYYLGALRLRQDRVPEAVSVLEVSASRAFAPAMYRLGRLYETGYGVPEDIAKAENLFRRAAELGNIWARRRIAVRMIKGNCGLGRVLPGLMEFGAVILSAAKSACKDLSDPRLMR